MRLWQALSYFVVEASKRLVRAWGASLVATLAIAISLFLVGFFLLVGHNLDRLTRTWSGEAKVVVYLQPGANAESVRGLVERLKTAPWVANLSEVDAIEAARRFREMFPSLADLVLEDQPFPRSLELEPRPGANFDGALEALAADPIVQLVDDDRDLVRQLRSITWVIRVVGLGLVSVLLFAALFTIGSVIRLKAYLDQDEISILRLVGSTEFFIRGPFLAEGVLQGALGGGVALASLAATAYALRQRFAELPLAQALFEQFLPWPQALGLVGLGALAGLVGTVVSLRRERLEPAAEEG
jgi:cell division transport system permease protein